MTSIENTESQPQCGTIHEEISDPGSEDISTVVINSNGGQLNELPNNELLNPTNSDMNKHWHLRNIVSQYLGIKSVFPSALSDSKTIITSRCMLARKIAEEHLTCATDKTFEDVLVQYREDQIPSEIDESSSTEIEQAVRELLQSLYWESSYTSNLLASSIRNRDESLFIYLLQPRQRSNGVHPGLNSIFLYENDSFQRDGITSNVYFIAQDYGKHTALTLSRFHAKTTLASPTLARAGGFGTKDVRIRFVIYQLLQAIAFLHSKSLVLDELTPSNILLDDYLWLRLPMSLSDRSCMSAIRKKSDPRMPRGYSKINKLKIYKSVDYDVPLTMQWINGKISNFDYVMAINHAAGRSMMDPLYHPILPWVTDFSKMNPEPGLGLRDLTKTKFRLSKGDPQLETTYKHSDPPHHIPESLSELTYYIYLARRTPLQVLRRVVRDVFVPEHYPSSMSRMYEWTPDECIPEFFTDPTVFESIHKHLHLPDLELPNFLSSPEIFIRHHRQIFESDYVSSNIHHWIDLTFGYCLQGPQAVMNMNVPLRQTLTACERLGDSPSLEKHPGFCMLFHQPHPRKKLPLPSNQIRSVTQSPTKRLIKYPVDKLSYFKNSSNSKELMQSSSKIKSSVLSSSLEAFIDLDTRPNNYKSKRKYEKKLTLLESANLQSSQGSNSNIPSNVFSFGSSYSISKGSHSTHPQNPRMQSLSIAYDTQPTWVALELAEDADISSEVVSKVRQRELEQYGVDYRFAERYYSLLSPSYNIPNDDVIASLESEQGSDIKVRLLKDYDTIKDVRCWDYEFARSVDDYQTKQLNTNSSNQINTRDDEEMVKELMADDMFAAGCVIAELFLGKPLLSKRDTLIMKLLSERSKNRKLSTSKIMKIIYHASPDNIPSNDHLTGPSNETNDNKNADDMDEQDDDGENLFGTSASFPIPLTICRLLTLLLQPDPSMRPTAAEILQACTAFDIDLWSKKDVGNLRSGGFKPGYIDFPPPKSKISSTNSQPSSGKRKKSEKIKPWELKVNGVIDGLLPPNMRLDILDQYCKPIFPAYFRKVYEFIGLIKLSQNGLERFQIIVDKISDMQYIPLEGLSLLMPHILEVIGDASPFKDDLIPRAETSHEITALSSYVNIIDVLGLRLGIEITEKVVIPRVAEFLNTMNSPFCLRHLLSTSTLWHVLIMRGGVRSFLRYFLPLLLTYLSSGTLQNISYGSSSYNNIGNSYSIAHNSGQTVTNGLSGGVSPLWATMGITDKTEWLHLCKKSELKSIQQVAVLAISSLVDPGGLGSGLTCRFVIPPLMSLIGIPQFSVAGYNTHEQQSESVKAEWVVIRNEAYEARNSNSINQNTSSNSSDPQTSNDQNIIAAGQKLEEYLNAYIMKDTQDMYTVHAVVAVCSHISELVTSELVLSRVCDEILPQLEPLFSIPIPAPSTVSALMEVVLLLSGILPNMSPETVCKHYLQHNRQSSICLCDLLTMTSLSNLWSITDDLLSGKDICDMEIYLESDRRYSFMFELVRLIVSASMIVGPSNCIEYVLPAVDKFFTNFVDTLGRCPVESCMMLRAFELGAELYLPLENFTAGAFHAAVPNLNPRLELWLESVGSGSSTRTSPPLPSNILPEIVVDHSNQEAKKRKGLFASWMSSTSSSQSKQTASTYTSSFSSMMYSRSSVSSTPSNMSSKNENNFAEAITDNHFSSTIGPTTAAPPSTITSTSSYNSNFAAVTKTNGKTDIEPPPDLSPVSSNVMASGYLSHKSKAIRTPFAKNSTKTDVDIVSGSVESDHSVTEGMELQAIERAITTPITPTTSRKLFHTTPTITTVTAECVDSDDDELPENATRSNSSESTTEKTPKESLEISNSSADIDEENPTSATEHEDTTPTSDLVENYDEIVDKVDTEESVTPRIELKVENLVTQLSEEKDLPDKAPSNKFIRPSIFLRELLSGRNSSPTGSNNSGNKRNNDNMPQRKRALSSTRASATSLHPFRSSELDATVEEELRDAYYTDVSWMLAGYGKWSTQTAISSESPSSSSNKSSMNLSQSSFPSFSNAYNQAVNSSNSYHYNTNTIAVTGGNHTSKGTKKPPRSTLSSSSNVPSAQVSMTAPRIAVDAAAEAGSLFALSMIVSTQFKVDDTPIVPVNNFVTSSSNTSNQTIRYIAVNPTESLLLSCSRAGTKLWSLNSHPIQHVSTFYNSSNSTPFVASFLRSGTHIATCDGCVNIWDVEKSRVVAYIGGSPLQSPFHSMFTTSSRHALSPGIQPLGDDQLLTSSSNFVLSHYDYRCPSRMNNLRAISEWHLPPLPSLPTTQMSAFTSSTQSNDATNNNHITCAISHESYVVAGSNQGGLWIVDRRMGKTLSSWQGHDSPLIKISPIDENHFLSIAERSAYIWSIPSLTTSTNISDSRKIVSIKNMPENASSPLTAATTIVASFDSSYGGGSGMHGFLAPDIRASQQIHVLYGVSGHKLYAGCIRPPSDSSTAFSEKNYNGTREVEQEEVKLAQTYFTDRNRNKITKQKLNVTSAVLLPLRRLMLLGADDGYIKVVS